MIIISPRTARAISPHAADQSWVMFVQSSPPGGFGPVKIEGVKGVQIAPRLRTLAADNAFEVLLIGLVPTPTPDEHAEAIKAQHAAAHAHHSWYEPTPALMAQVQATGQAALRDLLGQARRGNAPSTAVGIDELARHLNVSVPTVRRMVKAGDIPYLRLGKVLRFVPTDVIASLDRRR
jgi:excisionase family DNA binding protein